MQLDSFFSVASRIARRPPSVGDFKKIEELLQNAQALLTKHPDRRLELALSVQQLISHSSGSSSNINAHARRFAAEFARSVCETLPEPGQGIPSRSQAQDALISYATLHNLGAAAALRQNGAPALSSALVVGADLLDTTALVAGISKVGNAGEPRVVLALQKSLANKGRLDSLNVPDLLAVANGISRACEVCPTVATALVKRIELSIDTMNLQSICDACRVVAELSARPEANVGKQAEELISKTWQILATGLKKVLAEDSATASGMESLAPVLVGLARLVGSLGASNEEVADRLVVSLNEQVLKPCAPDLLRVVRQDPQCCEVIAPLLLAIGGGPWVTFLSHLALEGLPSFPSGALGAERCLALIEAVAAAKLGRPAFPPFFDFALEEMLRRLPDFALDSNAPVQLVKLFSQVHLERPDLLGPAVQILTSTAFASDVLERLQAAELSLRLSRLASLHARITTEIDMMNSGTSEKPDTSKVKELEGALVAIFDSFDRISAALKKVIQTRSREENPRLEESSHDDASCLAISAFTQVANRDVPSGKFDGLLSARHIFMTRGRELLEVASSSWRSEAIVLSAPQTHIFIMAVRSLCVGCDMTPFPATIAALEAQKGVLLSRAVAGEKEARLCLAMFEELGRDPNCPDALRQMLVPEAAGSASKTTESSAAANRMRQHMQSVAETRGDAWARGPTSAAASQPMQKSAGGVRNALRRWIGI